MIEMMVNGDQPKVFAPWFDIDFTKYAVGTTTGFADRGITFNRTGSATCSVVSEDGVNAMSFNGDGVLSAGQTPDKLLNNDWRITMNLKIKTGSTNPMLFLGRSVQSSGGGAWIANMFQDGRLDWWYSGSRTSSTTAMTYGVWHEVIYESVANKLTVKVDGTVLINAVTIPNVADGTSFNLLMGGSGDVAMYHSRMFLRRMLVETKKR